MTATMNIRKSAQFIGFAVCTLFVHAFLWVIGILWNIVSGIVNGVFQMVIGVIVVILSFIAFFGFILWLFTL